MPSKTVLVVDDNHDAADSAAILLRIYDYDVRVAYNPTEALAADVPNFVILELRLSEMDGWELTRQMQQRDRLNKSHFVAVTTYGRDSDRIRSLAAGIDFHFVKPVETSTLLKALRFLEN